MTRYSGQLSHMVEVDDDGCQWTTAVVPPSDSDSGSSGEEVDDEDEGEVSPTSVVQGVVIKPKPSLR